MRAHLGYVARRLARLRERRAVLFLALLFALFLALSLLIRAPGMQEVDLAVTQAIQARRSLALDKLAISLSFLGNTGTLTVVGLIAALFFWRLGRPWAALLAALSVLGVPLNYLIKLLIGRPRPDEGVVAVLLPTVGLSFPSGHAMASTMVYGFLALMAWVHLPRRRPRLALTAALAAITLGVSMSRVYLGAHWFSDVVGGWVAGLFFLLLAAEAYQLLAADEPVDAAVTSGAPDVARRHGPG